MKTWAFFKLYRKKTKRNGTEERWIPAAYRCWETLVLLYRSGQIGYNKIMDQEDETLKGRDIGWIC